jgi:uncharacterized protein YlaN (UPF0358 family)
MAKQTTMKNAALKQLTKDADEILHLIKVQLDNLTSLVNCFKAAFFIVVCFAMTRSPSI